MLTTDHRNGNVDIELLKPLPVMEVALACFLGLQTAWQEASIIRIQMIVLGSLWDARLIYVGLSLLGLVSECSPKRT